MSATAGATQAEIAMGDTVVRASQFDISQKLFDGPSYKFNQQNPNTYGQPISLTAGNAITTINVPPEVYNLGITLLDYTLTVPVPLTAGNYNWIHSDIVAEIQHVQFFTSSNQLIVDTDNLNNYNKIIQKKETNLTDFLTNDITDTLYPSNIVLFSFVSVNVTVFDVSVLIAFDLNSGAGLIKLIEL